jgi:hemerythrin-like domain-containing protein
MPRDRVHAWDLELQNAHHRLERAVDRVRVSLLAGKQVEAIKPDLRARCHTFCAALGSHHRSEDDGFFPALLGQAPELRPVIERLARDHRRLARLLADFQRCLDSGESSPERLLVRINEIKSVMNAHFADEERSLNPALQEFRARAGDRGRMLGDV